MSLELRNATEKKITANLSKLERHRKQQQQQQQMLTRLFAAEQTNQQQTLNQQENKITIKSRTSKSDKTYLFAKNIYRANNNNSNNTYNQRQQTKL